MVPRQTHKYHPISGHISNTSCLHRGQGANLGAGTGATQISAALSAVILRNLGYNVPSLKVYNIDTSPFMLRYNRDYLWRMFIKEYSEIENFSCEYSVNSWVNPENNEPTNPWFIASYLFDYSEKKEELKNDFIKIVETHQPEKIFLITSNQSRKIKLLQEVRARISESQEYRLQNNSVFQPFSGIMEQTKYAKEQIRDRIGVGTVNAPYWEEKKFHAEVLNRTTGMLDFSSTTSSNNSLNIFMPPIKVRRDIVLNESQIKAASLNSRPTIITGPAGCGKSVVISERIKNVVESEGIPYDSNLRILVTTFNKNLINYLSDWIQDILDEEKIILM